MRCASCLWTSPESASLPLEELGARLALCNDCPMERGEGPCPPEAAALLISRQREALKALRRQRNQLRQAEHELRELRSEMERSEARVAKLEQVQKASHQEIEQALRAQLEIVRRQGESILALSTPIIQVWEGILVLPIIGALDDARAAGVMEGLLHGVVSRQARYAILDLTGVPGMDAPTAGHLVKVVRAARLLGAEVLLCGVGPQVARAVTELGLSLDGARTVASLAEALRHCGVGRRGGAG